MGKNIVGKGENAVDQHLLLFPQCFQMASSLRVNKSQDCVVKSQTGILHKMAKMLSKLKAFANNN